MLTFLDSCFRQLPKFLCFFLTICLPFYSSVCTIIYRTSSRCLGCDSSVVLFSHMLCSIFMKTLNVAIKSIQAGKLLWIPHGRVSAFLFMAETQMIREVEAIREGWRAMHICQRDREKKVIFRHILMHRHTRQTLLRPLQCFRRACGKTVWVSVGRPIRLLPFLINALTLHIFLARIEEPKLKSPQRPFTEACWVVRCRGQNKADIIFQNQQNNLGVVPVSF